MKPVNLSFSSLCALLVFLGFGCNVTDSINNNLDPDEDFQTLTVKLTSIPQHVVGEVVTIYATNEDGLVSDDIQSKKLSSDTVEIDIRLPGSGPFDIWAIVDTSQTFDIITSSDFPQGSCVAFFLDVNITGPDTKVLSVWNVVTDDEGTLEEIQTDAGVNAPDGVNAVINASDTSLTLSWNEWDNAISYYVYYAADSAVSKSDTKVSVAGFQKKFTSSTLVYGETYTFAVMGNNSAGYDSELSSAITILFEVADTTQGDTTAADTLVVGGGTGAASDPRIIAFPSDLNSAGTVETQESYFFKTHIPQNRLVIFRCTYGMGVGPTMYVRNSEGKLLRNNKGNLPNAREQLIEIAESGVYTIEIQGGSAFAQNVRLAVTDYDTLDGNSGGHLATVLSEASGMITDNVKASVDISGNNDNYNYPQSAYYKLSVNSGDSLKISGFSDTYNSLSIYFYDALNDSSYLPSGYWNDVEFDSLGSKFEIDFTGDLLIRITGVAEYEGIEQQNPFTFYYSLNGKIDFGTSGDADAFIVTFNSNGGSSVESQQIEEGAVVLRPSDPTKADNTFVGWYRDVDLTDEWDFSAPLSGELELFAKWESDEDVVNSLGALIYNIDNSDTSITLSWPALTGGTIMYVVEWAVGNMIPEVAAEDQLSTTVFDDSTYCVLHSNYHGSWTRILSLDSTYSFTVRAYSNGDWIPTDTITVDFTIGSDVEPDGFGIVFESNGGTSIESQQVEGGSAVLRPADPVKTDNAFAGWYRDEELTLEWDFSTSVTDDVVLYAKWEADRYTIYYNLNGGENSDGNPETYTVESETITFQAPSKTDWIFLDWYQDETFETIISEIPSGQTGDVTLFAKWQWNGENPVDGDGNEYTTIQIGNQVWTVENLRTTSYADGTEIPLVTNNTEWENLSTPAYCYYKNTSNIDSIVKFGGLYNYYTVANTNSNSIAPLGWRVPTDADWEILQDYLGGSGEAGGKMKTVGTSDWNSPNTGATSESGFLALPGGYRSDYGDFAYIGNNGHWWAGTEIDAQYAYMRNIYHSDKQLARADINKRVGNSVRLVRD